MRDQRITTALLVLGFSGICAAALETDSSRIFDISVLNDIGVLVGALPMLLSALALFLIGTVQLLGFAIECAEELNLKLAQRIDWLIWILTVVVAFGISSATCFVVLELMA